MALTDEDKQEILNAIKAESQGIDDLEVVSSLDNITSLPSMRGKYLVSVPVALLRKPADEAARIARAAALGADEATKNATIAAQSANESAQKAEHVIANTPIHQLLSEDDYEALPEKDDNTLYLTYEEE